MHGAGAAQVLIAPHLPIAASGRQLRAVSFAYRYVVGYSGNGGAPGPSFELELVDGAELLPGAPPMHLPQPQLTNNGEADRPRDWRRPSQCPCCAARWGGAAAAVGGPPSDDDDTPSMTAAVSCEACAPDETEPPPPPPLVEPVVHVLYRSPQAEATPYSWDAATGGHPTNYCPTIEVREECAAVGVLRGETQLLRLKFTNGKRNMHLQGGAWTQGAPGDACVELGMKLEWA